MLNAVRLNEKFMPDSSRVIVKPHIPTDINRVRSIITRVLNLPEENVGKILDKVITDFSTRHKNIYQILENNYNQIKKHIPDNIQISANRKLLFGAYFSCEYSIQSAAFFNPSIVPHPNQSEVEEGSLRFILSFRSVGEGHISSIEFRSGIIDKDCNFTFDKVSPFIQRADVIGKHYGDGVISDYELKFDVNQDLSERVIYPCLQNECNGIEDARFVRFVDDDNSVTYYATYTAYDGHNITPQIIETKDFLNFKIITLSGKYSKNKGMAIFPRKIKGKHAMISRIDGENLYIMYSENLHYWESAEIIKQPENYWEFFQIGNCGSPVETDRGWILLTHGVGPMREYSIGVVLLDIENPAKIIGNMNEPLLICNPEEREGYVPNVVYSCGSIIHNDNLIMPYAMSDTCSGIIKISLNELFDNFKLKEISETYAKSP